MDRLFGLDRSHVEPDMELLTTAHDDVELAILCDILQTEGIPYLKQDRGSGASVRIITGYSMYGTDISVPRAELERAREILEAYRNAEPIEDDELEEAEEDEE